MQNKNSEFSAPLTSFDWNETDLNRLGTSSIDTTCTIWDIEASRNLLPSACLTHFAWSGPQISHCQPTF